MDLPVGAVALRAQPRRESPRRGAARGHLLAVPDAARRDRRQADRSLRRPLADDCGRDRRRDRHARPLFRPGTARGVRRRRDERAVGRLFRSGDAEPGRAAQHARHPGARFQQLHADEFAVPVSGAAHRRIFDRPRRTRRHVPLSGDPLARADHAACGPGGRASGRHPPWREGAWRRHSRHAVGSRRAQHARCRQPPQRGAQPVSDLSDSAWAAVSRS